MISPLLIVIVLVVAAVCILVAWLQPWRLLPPSTGLFPAVPTSSFMGCGTELGRAYANGTIDLLLFRWLRDFGNNRLVAIAAPGNLLLIVNDPEISRVVNNGRDFHLTNVTIDTFGTYAKGLIALEGEIWGVHRRAVTRAFYPDNLRLAFTAVDGVVSAWLANLVSAAAPGAHVQWNSERTFIALYLDTMGRAMLSTDFRGLASASEVVDKSPQHTGTHSTPWNVLDAFNVVFQTISKLSGIPKSLWGILMPTAEMKKYDAATTFIRK